MTDINPVATVPGGEPWFLREEEVRHGIELLFFAYRDFTAEPDAILAQYGFGRAHHRVVHFVGRHPQMTVGDLLGILRITKQSLNRVLGQLVRQGLHNGVVPGRQRLADGQQDQLARLASHEDKLLMPLDQLAHDVGPGLHQLDQLAAPFPEFAAFLRQLAAGELQPIPPGLPAALGQWLEDLAQAIRAAPRGSTP